MSVLLKNEVPEAAQPLLERYLAELEAIYPAAKGHTEISVERDGTIWVCYPWPEDEDLHIAISERMAEVATDILVETNQHIRLLPTRELSSNGDETVRP
jgi:hypothetical protein